MTGMLRICRSTLDESMTPFPQLFWEPPGRLPNILLLVRYPRECHFKGPLKPQIVINTVFLPFLPLVVYREIEIPDETGDDEPHLHVS